MLDVDYFLYKPKFEKDIPVFVRTDTGEECRPCYWKDGTLKQSKDHFDMMQRILVRLSNGDEALINTVLLEVKSGRGEES